MRTISNAQSLTTAVLTCVIGILMTTTFAKAQNLPILSATYLGGSSAGGGDSVDVAPDGTFVWAGVVNGTNFGLTPKPLLGSGGTGALLRVNAQGTSVLSVTRIGGEIKEARIDPTNGAIAVCGTFGVAVLNSTASSVLWSNSAIGAVNRIAIAADGTVAALTGLQSAKITVFNATGTVLSQHAANSVWFIRDVAIDAATKTMFFCGDYNTSLPSGGPVRVAFMEAFSYTGVYAWWDYGWSGSKLTGYEADTQGDRIRMGRDGYVYFAGASAGGNTIFGRSPKVLTTAAPLSTYDAYSTPYQTGRYGRTFAFAGRYKAIDGSMVAGQYLIPRLNTDGTGDGNSAFPVGITAANDGTVYVGMNAGAYLPKRSALTLSGIAVPAYNGGDISVAILTPDMSKRQLWTTWGGGYLTDVAASSSSAAMSATIGAATATGDVTYHAIQSKPAATSTGYLSTWSTITAPSVSPH